MAHSLALEVLTPEQTLLAGAVTAVSLRTSGGSLTVLPGRAPFVGDIVPGEVRVEREDASAVRVAVHGGYVQVDTRRGAASGLAGGEDGPIAGVSTRVTLLVGIAELAEDIDLPRAEAARADAQARLDQLRAAGTRGGDTADAGVVADLERAEAEQALARAELRIAVGSGA